MYQKFIAKFNNISFSIIIGVCALLPLFFLPATISGLGAVKGVFLYIGVLLAFSFWLVAQFIEGNLRVPKHKALLALGAWVVLVLISALTSKNISVSLWGRGFSMDSFSTVLVLSMFVFLIASFAREQRRLIKLFLAAFTGSVATILLQVVLYVSQNVSFVNKYLIHVASQGTLVGSWVDFAHFVTFTFLLALLIYEVLVPKGFFKGLSLFAMILSLIVLVFLNFKAAWIVTVISALLVFVYKSSVERSLSKMMPNAEMSMEPVNENDKSSFPILSFAALLVGLFFFLSSNSIGAILANKAGVAFNDIRPSFGSTMSVVKSTLRHDPFFGAGGGRFSDMWNLYRPAEINQTNFWNTSFDSGFNMVGTNLATHGTLATIAFIALLVFSLMLGFKLFNAQFPDRFSRFISVTSFIMLAAFTSLFLLASPGIVLITLGFMYLGILIGVSVLIGKTSLGFINYLSDPRTSFFAILLLVVATMAGFSAVYFSGNRFASIILYNKAIAAKDFPTAQLRLDRAISLSENDIYWRTRTALFTSQFATEAKKESPDKTQLQAYFTQAEQSARAAVAWDNTNANNWLSLSQVYQLVSDEKAEDAYKNAKQAAEEAQSRNKNNPVFSLNFAQIALTQKDTDGALKSIDEALKLKPNYLDAFVLKAQIKGSQGDGEGAKDEIANYVKVAPFDDQGYLLLGQAELALKNYSAALDAFAQAKKISPNNPSNYLDYINTLVIMGQKTQAVEELKALKARFPNISGIDEEIAQIQKGSSSDTTTTTDTDTKKN
jgi:cytochrome c-type biogenesis protein CcmH/NrfG